MSIVWLIAGASSDNVRIYAQPLVPSVTPAPPASGTSNTPVGYSDTFSMFGPISNIYSSGMQKFILSGNWTMNVNHGRTSSFIVNMFAVLTNGSRFHTHTIGHFRQDDNSMAILDPSNNVLIRGISDIGFNKNPVEWKDVNTTISVGDGKALSIRLNDNQTSGHFANQPIYGMVKSILKSVALSQF